MTCGLNTSLQYQMPLSYLFSDERKETKKWSPDLPINFFCSLPLYGIVTVGFAIIVRSLDVKFIW